MRAVIIFWGIMMSAGPTWAQRFETAGCSRSERSTIRAAMRWLIDSMPLYDQHLKHSALTDWPGRSRKRFLTRLKRRHLRLVCRKKSEVCAGDKVPYWIKLGERRLPVRHGMRREASILLTATPTLQSYKITLSDFTKS